MTHTDKLLYTVAASHVGHVKAAADPVVAHSLSGRLYLSKSGWLLLDVPNSLVRGAFDALHEAGAELPYKSNGSLNAHISVMTPDEIAKIGGPDKISERGHQFKYTLGPLKEVEPAGWKEMSKVWFVEVKSPELRKLRTSYGLTPLPNGDHEFHITIAVRKKKVLQHNDVKKASKAYRCETCGERFEIDPPASKCPECSGDSVPEDSYLEKNDRKLKNLRAFLSKFSEEELDGIRVDYHPDKPQMVWIDIMDWGDSKNVGQQIIRAAKRFVGEENVTIVNEGGAPTRDAKGRKNHGACKESDGTKGWVAVKRAGMFVPLLRAGGLAADIAGLQAIAGGGKEREGEPDPATMIEEDTSYLDNLRVKKRKKPVSVTIPVQQSVLADKLAEIAKVIPMTGHQQETNYSCGPAALKVVEQHYGKDQAEQTLRKETKSNKDEGTKPEELAQQAQKDGLQATLRENMSIDDLKRKVDSGEPTIVNLQAWGESPEEYKKDESGHYVTITGYDDQYFYFKDPVLGDKPGKLTHEELDRRWHDEEGTGQKTDHLGVSVDKPNKTVDELPVVKDAPKARKIASPIHLLKRGADCQTIRVLMPELDKRADTPKEKKKRSIPAALAAAAGLGVGGAGAYALMDTDTSAAHVPAAVARFPGRGPYSQQMQVIRGQIRPDAPASTIESTGEGYLSAHSPEVFPNLSYDRYHLRADDVNELVQGIQSKLQPGKRLGVLEVTGHGAPWGMAIGKGRGPLGNLGWNLTDERQAVEDARQGFGPKPPETNKLPTGMEGITEAPANKVLTEALSKTPMGPNALCALYGCNTGLAKGPLEWQQQIANAGKARVVAPMAIGTLGLGTDLKEPRSGTQVATSIYGPAYDYKPTELIDKPGREKWKEFVPGDEHGHAFVDQKALPWEGHYASKRTLLGLPNNQWFQGLYQAGKPAAIGGALAAPLFGTERNAKRTALISSLLASPMALSEVLTRATESGGNAYLGKENLLGALANQGKALPYIGLAALPWASYGLAKSLGRWKNDKEREKKGEHIASFLGRIAASQS